MRTVSTKLDNRTHDQFIEICNEAGKCQSEMIRYLIETMCEDLEEEPNLTIREATPQDLELEHTSEDRETPMVQNARVIENTPSQESH